MGARMYVVERDSDRWNYTYSHWGANRIREVVRDYYAEDTTLEELEEKMEEAKEQELESRNEPIQGTEDELEDVVNFDDIGIEAYYIKDGEERYVAFTFINSEIHGGVISKVEEARDLVDLKRAYDYIHHYLSIATREPGNKLSDEKKVRTKEKAKAYFQNVLKRTGESKRHLVFGEFDRNDALIVGKVQKLPA